MRPATDTIPAPPFPRSLPWVNTEQLRIDKQLGRPLVIAFWDQHRAASMRALLELEQLHRRFGPRGARVIAVHVDSEGEASTHDAVEAVARRLDLTLPIVLDDELQIAEAFGLRGVPSRYIFNQGLILADAHFGLGGMADAEQLVRALVEHGEQRLAQQRDAHGHAAQVTPAEPAGEPEVDESCDQGANIPAAKQPRLLVHPPAATALPEPLPDPAPLVAPVPGELLPGDWRGAYEARAVWLDLEGSGTVQAAGREPLTIAGDGTYLLVDHGHQAAGQLEFGLEGPLTCRSIQLEPGLLPAG